MSFPSPAADFVEKHLDLNERFIPRPNSSFFAKVKEQALVKSGIYPNDLLIIDRSLTAKHNDIVLATIKGEFYLGKLFKKSSNYYFYSENNFPKPILLTNDHEFNIWGVVQHSIRSFR